MACNLVCFRERLEDRRLLDRFRVDFFDRAVLFRPLVVVLFLLATE